jgi:hypothetical protein
MLIPVRFLGTEDGTHISTLQQQSAPVVYVVMPQSSMLQQQMCWVQCMTGTCTMDQISTQSDQGAQAFVPNNAPFVQDVRSFVPDDQTTTQSVQDSGCFVPIGQPPTQFIQNGTAFVPMEQRTIQSVPDVRTYTQTSAPSAQYMSTFAPTVPNRAPLVQDVGNCVPTWSWQLKEGTVEQREAAVDMICQYVVDLSFNQGEQGCRLVQSALEGNISLKAKIDIAEGLRGHVERAMKSKFANHVLWKIIEELPAGKADFIPGELLSPGKPREVAKLRFGCRIVGRLFAHGVAGEALANEFLNKVSEEALDLSDTEYGHYCLREILEHGSHEQRDRIVDALTGYLKRLAPRRYSSLVVEAVFEWCPEESRMALAEELLRDPQTVGHIVLNQFGRHVIGKLLSFEDDLASRTWASVSSNPRITSSKDGKRLLRQLGSTFRAKVEA